MTAPDKFFLYVASGLYLAVGMLHAAYHYQRYECDRPVTLMAFCDSTRRMAVPIRIAIWPITLGWDISLAATKPRKNHDR